MSSRACAQKWTYKRYRQYETTKRKIAADWFISKGHETDSKYPFILKKYNDWHKNIILPEVAAYIKNEMAAQDSFPLHKYIHHGLSSQAMAFNLIGPLIIRSDFGPLTSLLKKKRVRLDYKIQEVEFEYDDRTVFNEDSGQPTSIDLALKNDNGDPFIFIESKLVEREFGGCSVYKLGDCDGSNPSKDLSSCYLHFIERKYWEKMIEYDFMRTPIGTDSCCALVNNYQYFREVLFALSKGGIFILLFDKDNPTFFNDNGIKPKGLMEYLKRLTPEQHHDRIAYISIQELASEIELSGRHKWIDEFKIKYGIK